MQTSSSISLKVLEVFKSFETETDVVEVLKGISFETYAGETLAITGPSGSGKSTLLHLLGTLDHPSSGKIEVGGRDVETLSEPELAAFRNRFIGFVFQDHHLLPQYSVVENVLIPTRAFPRKRGSKENDGSEERARSLLERVGLSHRVQHRPAELSGGERQRTAVARALINKPHLLLCDEPTGNLDRSTAAAVAALLFELHRDENNILISVTHSLELAKRFQRRLELVEGRCSEV